MVSFGNLYYIIILLLNAIAVLSKDRFLARVNLSPETYRPTFVPDTSVRGKIVSLIASVHMLRKPLTPINTLTMVYVLLFG